MLRQHHFNASPRRNLFPLSRQQYPVPYPPPDSPVPSPDSPLLPRRTCFFDAPLSRGPQQLPAKRRRRPPLSTQLLAVLSFLFLPALADPATPTRTFYDPDCVRDDPFWGKYRDLVSAQVGIGEKPDFHVSRYALEIKGCPLGKLVACIGSQNLPIIDCLHLISSDFFLLVSSRWPILALLDMEQQRIWDSGELQNHNPDDCIVAAHPTLDWNEFRGALDKAVPEAYDWVLQERKDAERANLEYAVRHGEGIVVRGANGITAEQKGAPSETVDTGELVSVLLQQCEFGMVASQALKLFAILLSQSDTHRVLERGFQTLEKLWHFKV